MPQRARPNNPTKRNTTVLSSALSNTLSFTTALVLLTLWVCSPAMATVYNSNNPDNPENRANPWQEDLQQDVGIMQRVNSPVPTDLTLIDEDGEPVELGSFFESGRPVIFNLGYSRCPSICILMRNQVTEVLVSADELTLGEDCIILNISIDPEETPEQARAMRDEVWAKLSDQGVTPSPKGWRFLTADQETITALTQALGYRYIYIEPQNEYGHPGVLVIANGDGVIKRYMSGTDYSANTLEISIAEISEGSSGSFWNGVYLTCFEWDPDANNYVMTARFVMMTGGGVILVFVIGLVLVGLAYERRRKQLLEAGQSVDKIERPLMLLFGGFTRRSGPNG